MRRLFLLLTALALIAAACGSSSGVDSTTDEGAIDKGAVDEMTKSVVEASSSVDAGQETSTDESDAPGDDEPATEPAHKSAAPEPTPAPVALKPVAYDGSFASSIQPILEEKCASCHYDGGPGAFHWNLRTAQDIADTHLLVEHVITTKSMPPWPAGELSVAFKGDRSLRSDQVTAIVDWVADGAPIDVQPSQPIEPINGLVGLADPDMVVGPLAPYAGDLSIKDDLRCLIYDLELEEGGWVTGYEFLPDQTSVVHHAVGFLMPAEARGAADARDGQDGRPGWACPGMAGFPSAPTVLWTPGQAPTIFDEGIGLRVTPGDFMVMQMHYHYDGQAPLDDSSLALMVEPAEADLQELSYWFVSAPVEIPCAEWETGPLCDRDAALANAIERFGDGGEIATFVNRQCGVTPADFAHFTNGVAESSCTILAPLAPVQDSVELDTLVLHMHQLGDWVRLTLNQGTPEELVLVDIPTWDYDWQYSYVPEDSIIVEHGDQLTLECGWDRSLRNSSLEPAWILWAEGSNDEMCVASVEVH